ncbi:maleylacetoacetate isomerase [Sphingomonas kaistensis]|uniref:Maleylacetoacetate isomerase n=1 Tax=Sphingomonas kaistensis TaxID=298708 RepID=A0A7X5Y7W2_9SPHN|nr:maleylacetoacetate isomerase [Sphingomonas kaistensis]NJC05156.1 maleylacetoacetate isomerase [Sphingomonas kaistensis]
MPRIVLHDYFRSSASYRVRIALNLKGLAYDQHPVSLVAGEQQSPEYKALNPQGFVPMVEIDGERVTQSLAIFDRLDALVEEPPFVPSDPPGRAHVLALALTVACDIHPLNNLRVLRYLKTELGQPQEAVDAWYRHWVVEGLAALEALAAPQAGTFLYGDQLSMADICLVPQLYNGRRFDVPMDAYPTLLRAEAATLALAPVEAAHPDRQETAQ